VIPEDRIEQGLVLISPSGQIIIGYKKDKRFEKCGILNMKRVNQYVDDLIKKYDIRPARRSAVVVLCPGGTNRKSSWQGSWKGPD
jgi:ABC-type uncharacterized transport system ATPase subunit